MTSLERSFTSSPTKQATLWKFPLFHWSRAGIRTKILVPLILLMILSLLGSAIGFIVSTNTTRNTILDNQLEQEAQRLTLALGQSEQDLSNGSQVLARDPELISALINDHPGSEAIMRMDSRVLPVRNRFRLDQVLVRNTDNQVRVNITTYTDLSEITFYNHPRLVSCNANAQQHLLHIGETMLLVSCAPIWNNIYDTSNKPSSSNHKVIGTIYTVLDMQRTLQRLQQELGLSSDIQIPNQEQPLGQQIHSINNYRIRALNIHLVGEPIEILLLHSEQEINEIVAAGFQVMMISTSITFVLLLTLGVWLAQSFIHPILKLDRVAQAVAAGDFSQRAHFHHQDEIGRLGRSFDHATTTIAGLLDEIAQTAGERQAIIESMADGLLAVDKNEHIIMVNPVAAEFFGQDPEALLLKPLSHLADVEDPVLAIGLSHVIEQVQTELTDPNIDKTEKCISLAQRTVRLHSAPILGAGGTITGAVVVIQDISQAVEADRAKSAFIGTASHELRTPLASMKGFVDIFYLSGIENLTNEQRDFLEVIHRQTNNMIQLVNDLLEVARLEQRSNRGELQWVSLQNALDETIMSLNPQIQAKEIQLRKENAPYLPYIWIDNLHLRRILTNLLSNAVKYVHHGGSVWIRTYELYDPALLPSQPKGQPWKQSEQRSVVVEIEDNGVGIRACDQPKIFNRFFRSDNCLSVQAGGTGLGLSITKTLVNLHHGQIGFWSVEEEGTCFWVRFPAPNTEFLHT